MTGDGPVFSLLRHMSERDRTIILIRHSHRPSLQKIPYEMRPEVELTPEGITMARQFGEALCDVIPDGRIHLLHTPAKRCLMTATALQEGLSSCDFADITIRSDPEIIDPIVDLEKFREQREYFGWHGLIRNWLGRKIDTGILWNPEEYSERLMELLLECPYVKKGDILLVVAHDITLFPVIHTYFKRCMTTIGYLNGIVMKSDECITEIGFEENIMSFPGGTTRLRV